MAIKRAGVRIDVEDGGIRRVDLNAAKARREAAERSAQAVPPIEDDRVARAWERDERTKAAQADAAARIAAVKEPIRKAEEKHDVRRREWLMGEADKDARKGRTGSILHATATPERLAMAGAEVEIGAATRTQRLSDAPLDRLNAKRIITDRQHEAGQRILLHWTLGNMEGVGAFDMSRVTSRGSTDHTSLALRITERQAEFRDKFRAAVKALGHRLYPVVHEVVVEGLAGDKLEDIGARLFGRQHRAQAIAAVVEVLKVGLDVLADHYGIEDKAKAAERLPRRRSWMADDAKPRHHDEMHGIIDVEPARSS